MPLLSKSKAAWLWPRFSAFFFGCWAMGLLMLLMLIELRGEKGILDEHSITYGDFTTILLTTVAVILAVMTAVIAILAFAGFKHLLDQSQESAEEAARDYMKAALAEGHPFRQHVDEKLEEIDRERRLKAAIPNDPEAHEDPETDDEFDYEDSQNPDYKKMLEAINITVADTAEAEAEIEAAIASMVLDDKDKDDGQ